MTDQCIHCTMRGKLEECLQSECHLLDTWIVKALQDALKAEHSLKNVAEAGLMAKAISERDALLDELEELRDVIKTHDHKRIIALGNKWGKEND